MKKNSLLCITICFLFLQIKINERTDFKKFTEKFVLEYRSFHIKGIQLSYLENLQNIKSADSVEKQIQFFSSIERELKNFDRLRLTKTEQEDYDLINYETHLNFERLHLEKQWLSEKPEMISETGLYSLPNGKKLYEYFLKRWVAADVTPDEVYQFGLKEVERVKQHIEAIRMKTGMKETSFYQQLNDDSFFFHNEHEVQEAFERTKKTVNKNLYRIFNVQDIPELTIARGTPDALVKTPGYYFNNTFYYNYYDKPYNKRQVDWLYIHEAVPGHHYQTSISKKIDQSDVHRLFNYLGFSEGWAAYTEELGNEINLYRTPYDELGKWEWDIVRSVRVPMDVGLNYYGWTDQQALAFWKKHVKNQDDIAQREITRMRRWPAQVVTYKYGALQIMQWKQELQKQQGKNFDVKAFHDRVLNKGSLPFFMVRKNVLLE